MKSINTSISDDFEQYHHRLVNSLLYFTQVFYYIRTGRKFELSEPIGRESHFISICRKLVAVFDGEINKLIINIPPRYGKTELVIHFVAWALAQYPDSNFLYSSYAHSLAKKQTQTIRNILQMKEYQDIFRVKIKEDTSAKDNFETTSNGVVFAAGAGGSITGRGAGIKNCNRFGGCIIIDDIHKPDEATSDTIREGVNEWYYNTLQSRVNSPNTPIIFIGQRVHEDDLVSQLLKSAEWDSLVLPALDEAGNALYPSMHNVIDLTKMQKLQPYVFSAQYQQNPLPAGGALFKEDDFYLMEELPDIKTTFITCDSAETEKQYNDATVFSFWGVYPIEFRGNVLDGLYGLHWLDCLEIRIEPKDLEQEFLNFWSACLRYPIKPKFAAIEKKSTGVTLLSVLKKVQGLRLVEIERNKASGSKSDRFLDMQQYISSKQVSLPLDGKHTRKCIDHMKKITANNAHRFDDIADTCYDAIKLALIDKFVILNEIKSNNYEDVAKNIFKTSNKVDRLKKAAYLR